MLFIIGTNQIIIHPGVLQALSPHYAYNLLAHYPKGFWLLGAVFLCTTGAEALYSDLGHSGIKNIRITWLFVKISLVACYLGQAAWLMQQGPGVLAGRNPFFEIIPHWFLIPGIIIATLAAIIASQALISGSFTLISEAMNLNFWQNKEPPTIHAKFTPQPDITLMELAKIVNGLVAHQGPIIFGVDSWEGLPPEIKRHFWPVGGNP